MGFRDRLQAKLTKHGGVRGLAKAAMGRGETGSSTADRAALPGPDGAWHALTWSDRVQEGRPAQVIRLGEAIAVFRTDKGLHAISNVCTHEDGPLGEGQVDGCVVTCPYHDWRFDLETGACLSHPNREVATYAVREAGGFVWLGDKRTEGSAERGGAHDDGMEVIVKDLD